MCAEESASLHAYHILKELKKLGNYTFWGTGSEALREVMETIYDASQLSFVGFEEPKKILRILAIYKHLKRLVRESQGVILVDYPGMNLRLAAFAKYLNKPVCYYVAPQVWAWGTWRVKKIKRSIDAMVCLFPFEESFFQKHGVNAKFFGHPLAERLSHLASEEKNNSIILLPGSRNSEVVRLLPVMLAVADKLKGNYSFFVVPSPSVDDRFYRQLPPWIKRVSFKDRYTYMSKARLALAASGTATLELALLKTPSVVLYKTSSVSWWIGKQLAKVNFLSIVNILMGREIFPECLQDNCTPEKVLEKTKILLKNTHVRENILKATSQLQKMLKGEDPYRRAAELFHETLLKTA